MPPSPALREILQLDPVRDHQRIVFLTFSQEFPWDAQRALEIALLRTFCVPSISRLLAATREFERRPQKRYDDTEIIISEIVEHGYDSPRGLSALRRMNQIHGRFAIDNDDYRYVLSTFLLEPIRWIDRFGYRRTIESERSAMFHFWCELGRRMHIRDLPDSLEAFERFNLDYERERFSYAETNRQVGAYSVGLFASWFPWPLGKLVPLGVYAMLDAHVRSAFGFPAPPRWVGKALDAALALRSRVLRLLPRRQTPKLRSRVTRSSYPRGYTLEEVGPAQARQRDDGAADPSIP
jgi:hypothetical protein